MALEINHVLDPKKKSETCESILRSLPAWFGIESAIIDYIHDVREMETLAMAVDGDLAGFLSLRRHNRWTLEIHVMGILKKFHRRGFGRLLLSSAEDFARSHEYQFLTVKTLSESRPSTEYDRTRNFYLGTGFIPLEEFKTLWGEANPCLMMIKSLRQ